MEISELKRNVAQNIFYLRTVNNMTQSELGAKINYSDKAISKWERADGLPDAFVLKRLSEIFDVSVDYLMDEHTEQDKKVDTKPIKNTKKLIAQTVTSGIIAVVVLLVVTLYLTLDLICWQMFVYCLPLIFLVNLIFSAVWWHGKGAFSCTSLLMWTTLLTIYIALLNQNNWQLFFIGIPAQLIIFLCYKMGITIAIVKKTSGLFKRKGEKRVKKESDSASKEINKNE